MPFSQVGFQSERLLRIFFDLCLARISRVEPLVNPGQGSREARVGERERWIVLDRFRVEAFRESEILKQTIRIRFVGPRFEIEEISLGILRRFCFDPVFFFRAESCPQLGCNLGGELALQSQRIGQRSVVSFAPEMPVRAGVD